MSDNSDDFGAVDGCDRFVPPPIPKPKPPTEQPSQ